MPFRLRIQLQQVLNLLGNGGRCNRAGKNTQACAAYSLHFDGHDLRGIEERGPGANLTSEGHRLRAIRIVQIQDGSLRYGIGGAQTGRVIGIAFDFCRPSFMAFDEHSDGVGAEGHRRSEKHRLAQNHPVRLLHIRNEVGLFVGLTAGEPRKGQ